MSSPSTSVALQGGCDDSVGDFCKFGVVTVSDRASTGFYDDLSGPAILQFFHEAIKSRCAAAAVAYARRHRPAAAAIDPRVDPRPPDSLAQPCNLVMHPSAMCLPAG